MDGKFSYRCCWTCVHCRLDILHGYQCDAVGPNMLPISLHSSDGKLHDDRSNCKAYKRG